MSEESLIALGQFTALAERLADESQMNLNKLVEAAIYAQICRAGWDHLVATWTTSPTFGSGGSSMT